MIPSGDLKIIALFRNALSVLIPILGLTWLWATKQEHWLKDYMEQSIVIVTSLIAFCLFLIGRWSGGQTIEKNKFYNILNTQLHRDSLAQAKAAIADGRPDEALKILSDIKVESVANAVSLLSGRWSERKRDQIAGVLEHTDRSFQQITRDVQSLINALETEMNTYGAVDKEVREYLKNRYNNRLEQKLAKRQPINLRRLPTTEGTSDETAEAFVSVSAEAVKAHIAQVFQAAYGRLLITGKPGAGKTVLLLQLELALLESETDQLPVILNLATWTQNYIALEPWLKDILPAELGVTKKYAVDILQQNRLILLLDGLDEVEEDDRVTCLEAIGRYRAGTDNRYVITSRIGEYSAISKDAPVNLQIEVGDLTLSQMKAELLRMGHAQPEAIPLLNALKKHPTLREAAQVPFYFNSLQLLFAGGKNLSDLGLKGHTAEAIQAELTPQFVGYALAIASDKNYDSQQAERWLSFLAYNMTERNRVVFELIDLQYGWSTFFRSAKFKFIVIEHRKLLTSSREILQDPFFISNYSPLISGLASAPLFGLFCAFWGALFGDYNGAWKGFLTGALLGTYFGAFSGNKVEGYPKIETRESIKWSWNHYLLHINRNTMVGFFVFLICTTFSSCPSHPTPPGGNIEEWSWLDSIQSIKVHFIENIFLGFISILTISLYYYLRNISKPIIQITDPYQRFKNSAKMLHLSILQHWHLMYVFSRKGWLPWRIVPFLNDMVAQQLLECPDGATWRFRHRILQEHFTKKWETNYRQLEKSKYE